MQKARRGQLWMIDLGLVQKPRPCLIFSIEYLDHERAVVSYIPRTTRTRGTRFEILHQARGLEAGAFDAQGIGTIPVAKLERLLGVVDQAIVGQVEVAVKLWLNLN